MYKLLILDLDGTICNSIPDIYNSMTIVFNKYHLSPPNINLTKDFMGAGLDSFISQSIYSSSTILEKETISNIKSDFIEYYSDHCIESSILYPGILQLLEYVFKNNIKLAIISNKKVNLINKILAHFNISTYFIRVYGGDSFIEKKPSPMPILKVLEEVNISASDTLMIGDSSKDIDSGANANVDTVFCIYGYGSIGLNKPTYTVNNANEIINIINGRGKKC